MQLRWYQQDALDAIFKHIAAKNNNPCVVLPTGSGKTPIIAEFCKTLTKAKPDARICVLSHVKELLEQSANHLSELAPELDVGIYSAGLNERNTTAPVLVAGIQSVYKRACEIGKINVCLIDEAHLITTSGDGMYRQFIKEAKVVNPKMKVIGLTATPFRTSSGLICSPDNILNEICYEVGVKELVVQEYLCKLLSRSGVHHVDTSELKLTGNDFALDEMQNLFNNDFMIVEACREITALTKDRHSVLVFTAGVKHGQKVFAKLSETGSAAYVDGNTPADERKKILDDFKNGQIKYLVNINVLTTGFDAPNIDSVVLLRATASPGLYYQMIGRGLRMHESKTDCLVLDYGENVYRHGPIDMIADNVRDKHKRKGGAAPVKECEKCKMLVSAGYRTCPICGASFPEPEEERVIHGYRADGSPILSGDEIVEEITVKQVAYFVHQKRNNPEAKPTLRVEYYEGKTLDEKPVKEWVCFEHTGFARQKAEAWWSARCNIPVPATVDEAYKIAMNGGVAEPTRIRTRLIAGEKWTRIVAAELIPYEYTPDELKEIKKALDENVCTKTELEQEFAEFFGIGQNNV